MTNNLKQWMRVPMTHWDSSVGTLSQSDLMELSDEASNHAVWLARLSAYISRRNTGGKHADAVKAQNRVARRVRQALGYTYADDKLQF